jgi:hypothetical protein
MTELVVPGVLELLGEYAGRLLWHRCRDSRHCDGPTGITDLIVAGPRGVLWAERKPGPWSPLRPGQTDWRHMLLASGQRHEIWTQREVDSGKVRADLDSIA